MDVVLPSRRLYRLVSDANILIRSEHSVCIRNVLNLGIVESVKIGRCVEVLDDRTRFETTIGAVAGLQYYRVFLGLASLEWGSVPYRHVRCRVESGSNNMGGR